MAGVRPKPKTLNKVLACLRRTRHSKRESSSAFMGGGNLPPMGASGSALGGSSGGAYEVPHFGVPGRGGGPGQMNGQRGGAGGAYGGGAAAQLRARLALSASSVVRGHEGLGLYESPAVQLYEEAQRLATVPLFQVYVYTRCVYTLCVYMYADHRQCCRVVTWQWRAPLVVGGCATVLPDLRYITH
eukprot:1195179-Prorocentrum_minimum.AAC.2